MMVVADMPEHDANDLAGGQTRGIDLHHPGRFDQRADGARPVDPIAKVKLPLNPLHGRPAAGELKQLALPALGSHHRIGIEEKFIAGVRKDHRAGVAAFHDAGMPPGQPALVALTQDNLAELRAEFNAAADRTRVVTLLAPT